MSNILIVDDDLSIQKIVAHYLRKAGYFVMVADSAKQALEMDLEAEPDILLLDKVMAGMGGLELLDKLKSDYATSFIRVIMLTSCGEVKDVVEGLDTGADDYVIKPFDPKILLARVRSQLRTKTLFDQLLRENESLKVRIAGSPQEELKIPRFEGQEKESIQEKTELPEEWPSELREIASNGIHKILFLCSANLFRSPIAELFFKLQINKTGIKSITVQSAALNGRSGGRLNDQALQSLSKLKINMVNHRSIALSGEMVKDADLVLVMEKNHLKKIKSDFPAASGKTFLLASFRKDGTEGREIADPVGKGKSIFDYRLCCHDLALSVTGVTNFLVKHVKKS